jgi:CheY-like chemotaxis protein
MKAVAVPKLRILVVDDEPSVGDAVKMLLTFDGHDVEALNNSREALTRFKAHRFDLVFTDYAMPGMNGNELAAAIKADAPGQPVVMITAYAETMPRSPSVDFVIGKPFRLQQLRDAITQVVLARPQPVLSQTDSPLAKP